MEVFLTILRYAAGPVLGAVIGYFTNWLAVKMLFRPRYPKMIGKWRLPFTPGIIPKRKPALAKAVGKAVGEQLLTKEDFTAAVVSDSAKQRVADYAVNFWKSVGDKSAAEALNGVIPTEQQENIMNTAEGFISDKIYNAVTGFNLGGVVAEEGVKVINQKKASLGMLSMFLSDGLINTLMDKLADGVNGYVEANGKRLISNAVKTELVKAVNSPLSSLSEKVEESTVKSIACTVYEVMVKSVFAELLDGIDISGIVEQKINDMDVRELEKLVLSVMKKELNAIVNLGALIGFILGIVMIFV